MALRALRLDETAAEDPEVGRWLSALADTRRRTMEALEGVSEEDVDRMPDGHDNSVGSLLYHIAAIEADWLFADILGPESGAEWPAALFPVDVRDDEGRLSGVDGRSLAEHLRRLEATRRFLIEHLHGMEPGDFHRPRARDDYDVAPDWTLHHLMQHEAEHRAQIDAVRAANERHR